MGGGITYSKSKEVKIMNKSAIITVLAVFYLFPALPWGLHGQRQWNSNGPDDQPHVAAVYCRVERRCMR